jgi:fructose-1,6-bisphosphatase I
MAGDSGETSTGLCAMLMRAAGRNPIRRSVAKVVGALASVACELSNSLALGPLGGRLGADVGDNNVDGDVRKQIDVNANAMIIEALRNTPTAYYASEEEDAILTLASNGLLAVAVDPLDGSSNVDANIAVGTIFSIFPASPEGATASFLRAGNQQIASGYFVYGSHTALVLTTGNGVDLYVLDRETATFQLAREHLLIAPATREFAINTSNYRHWPEPVRNFIDDCVAGSEGPRAKNFNMRWIASLVAETHRIFSRGGVFLYPADDRKGYERGRLRHVYEAAPIALLVEQAGGSATDGLSAILDRIPSSLHERTPLIFGSADKVALVVTYHRDPGLARERSPLFRNRGLFTA